MLCGQPSLLNYRFAGYVSSAKFAMAYSRYLRQRTNGCAIGKHLSPLNERIVEVQVKWPSNKIPTVAYDVSRLRIRGGIRQAGRVKRQHARVGSEKVVRHCFQEVGTIYALIEQGDCRVACGLVGRVERRKSTVSSCRKSESRGISAQLLACQVASCMFCLRSHGRNNHPCGSDRRDAGQERLVAVYPKFRTRTRPIGSEDTFTGRRAYRIRPVKHVNGDGERRNKTKECEARTRHLINVSSPENVVERH